MTDSEALKAVVARTHHVRYRDLVALDPAVWWPVVRAQAGVPDPYRFRLSPAEVAALAASATVWCLYRGPEPVRGACRPWRCHAAFGASCGGRFTDDAHCARCLHHRKD